MAEDFVWDPFAGEHIPLLDWLPPVSKHQMEVLSQKLGNLQPRGTFIILTSAGPRTVILTAGKEGINRIDKIEIPELAGISLLSHHSERNIIGSIFLFLF